MRTHLPFKLPKIFGAEKIMNHMLHSLQDESGRMEFDENELDEVLLRTDLSKITFVIKKVKHINGELIIETKVV